MHTRPHTERSLEHHRPELTRYCRRMLGSAVDAEDAAQETLVRAWRSLDRLEAQSCLRSWLYSIATNVCLDAHRGRLRRALPMDLSQRRRLGRPTREIPPSSPPRGTPSGGRSWPRCDTSPIASGPY